MSYKVTYYTELNGRLYNPSKEGYIKIIDNSKNLKDVKKKASYNIPNDTSYYKIESYTNKYDKSSYKMVFQKTIKNSNLK